MTNRSGLVPIRDIEELIDRGLGSREICIRLKLPYASQEKFVRDMAVRQAKREAA